MRTLRMKLKYIEMTKGGIKTGTTRMHELKLDDYELITGGFCQPKKSGVVIRIQNCIPFTSGTITELLKQEILKAENFATWGDYIRTLEELNECDIYATTELFFHPYKMIADRSKDVEAFL